jgi:hypothetical protein
MSFYDGDWINVDKIIASWYPGIQKERRMSKYSVPSIKYSLRDTPVYNNKFNESLSGPDYLISESIRKHTNRLGRMVRDKPILSGEKIWIKKYGSKLLLG